MDFLNRIAGYLLRNYFEDIEPSISLKGRQISFKGAKVRKDILLRYNYPYKVIGSIVDEVTFLLSEYKFIVKNFYVVLSYSPKEALESVPDFNDISFIPEIEHFCLEKKVKKKSLFMNFISSNYFQNLLVETEFNIENIHFRLQIRDEISNETKSIGFVIEKLNLKKSDDNSESSSIRKRLEITKLSVYINPNSSSIDDETDLIQRIDSCKTSNCYVIKDFSFTGDIILDTNANKISLIMNTNSLNISLNNTQYHSLSDMLRKLTTFGRLVTYYNLGRPKNNDVHKWWIYIHKCSAKKRNPHAVSKSVVKNFLKNRKNPLIMEYVANSGEKSRLQSKIEETRKLLGNEVYLLVFSYCGYKTRLDNINEEDRQMKNELINLLDTSNASSRKLLSFQGQIKQIGVDLGDSTDSSFCKILFGEIICSINNNNDNTIIDAVLSKMSIMHKYSDDMQSILSFKDGEKPMELQIHHRCNKVSVNLNISKPSINCDIKFINRIVNFFEEKNKSSISMLSLTKGTDYEYNIDKIFNEKVTYDLNFDIGAPIIEIPARDPFVLDMGRITVRSVKVDYDKNNSDTFYDKYDVNLYNFNVFVLQTTNNGYKEKFEVALVENSSVHLAILFVPVKEKQKFIVDYVVDTVSAKFSKLHFDNLMEYLNNFSRIKELKFDDSMIKEIVSTANYVTHNTQVESLYSNIKLNLKEFHFLSLSENGENEHDISLKNFLIDTNICNNNYTSELHFTTLNILYCGEDVLSFDTDSNESLLFTIGYKENLLDIMFKTVNFKLFLTDNWIVSLKNFFSFDYNRYYRDLDISEAVKSGAQKISYKVSIKLQDSLVSLQFYNDMKISYEVNLSAIEFDGDINEERSNLSFNIHNLNFLTNNYHCLSDYSFSFCYDCKKDFFSDFMMPELFLKVDTSTIEVFHSTLHYLESKYNSPDVKVVKIEKNEIDKLEGTLFLQRFYLMIYEKGTELYRFAIDGFNIKKDLFSIDCVSLVDIKLDRTLAVKNIEGNFNGAKTDIRMRIIMGDIDSHTFQDLTSRLSTPKKYTAASLNYEVDITDLKPKSVSLHVDELLLNTYVNNNLISILYAADLNVLHCDETCLEIDDIEMETNLLDMHKRYASISKLKLTFKDDKIDCSINSAFLGIQYQFIMKYVLDFFIYLFVAKEDSIKPPEITKLFINIGITNLTFSLITSDVQTVVFCKANNSTISNCNAFECYDINIPIIEIYDMEGVNLGSMKQLYSTLECIIKDFPAPKIIATISDEEKYTDRFFVHGIDLNISVKDVDFYYDKGIIPLHNVLRTLLHEDNGDESYYKKTFAFKFYTENLRINSPTFDINVMEFSLYTSDDLFGVSASNIKILSNKDLIDINALELNHSGTERSYKIESLEACISPSTKCVCTTLLNCPLLEGYGSDKDNNKVTACKLEVGSSNIRIFNSNRDYSMKISFFIRSADEGFLVNDFSASSCVNNTESVIVENFHVKVTVDDNVFDVEYSSAEFNIYTSDMVFASELLRDFSDISREQGSAKKDSVRYVIHPLNTNNIHMTLRFRYKNFSNIHRDIIIIKIDTFSLVMNDKLIDFSLRIDSLSVFDTTTMQHNLFMNRIYLQGISTDDEFQIVMLDDRPCFFISFSSLKTLKEYIGFVSTHLNRPVKESIVNYTFIVRNTSNSSIIIRSDVNESQDFVIEAKSDVGSIELVEHFTLKIRDLQYESTIHINQLSRPLFIGGSAVVSFTKCKEGDVLLVSSMLIFKSLSNVQSYLFYSKYRLSILNDCSESFPINCYLNDLFYISDRVISKEDKSVTRFNYRQLLTGSMMVSAICQKKRCKLLLNVETNPLTSVTTVEVSYPVIIENKLPEIIYIKPSNYLDFIKISPLSSTDIDVTDDFTAEFFTTFYPSMCTCHINKNTEYVEVFGRTSRTRIAVNLIKEKIGFYRVTFSSDFVVYNNTPYFLCMLEDKRSIDLDNYVNYFSSEKNYISIVLKGGASVHAKSKFNKSILGDVFLICHYKENIFVPLKVTIVKSSNNTSVATIFPSLYIRNSTHSKFVLAPDQNGDPRYSMVVEKGEIVHLQYCNSENIFCIIFEKRHVLRLKVTDLNDTSYSLLNYNININTEFVVQKGNTLLTVTECRFRTLKVITNNLDSDVKFNGLVVPGLSSQLIFNFSTSGCVQIGDQQIYINSGFGLSRGDRVITVNTIQDKKYTTISVDINDRKSKRFSGYRISIKGFDLSIFDLSYKEFLLLKVDGVNISYKFLGDRINTVLMIRSFNIYDINLTNFVPVILKSSCTNGPFVEVKASFFYTVPSYRHISYFILNIQPVELNISSLFLQDLMCFIKLGSNMFDIPATQIAPYKLDIKLTPSSFRIDYLDISKIKISISNRHDNSYCRRYNSNIFLIPGLKKFLEFSEFTDFPLSLDAVKFSNITSLDEFIPVLLDQFYVKNIKKFSNIFHYVVSSVRLDKVPEADRRLPKLPYAFSLRKIDPHDEFITSLQYELCRIKHKVNFIYSVSELKDKSYLVFTDYEIYKYSARDNRFEQLNVELFVIDKDFLYHRNKCIDFCHDKDRSLCISLIRSQMNFARNIIVSNAR